MISKRAKIRLQQIENLNALRSVRKATASYSLSRNTLSMKTATADNRLSQFAEAQRLEFEYFSSPVTVSNNEVDALLTDIASQWSDKQFELVLANCKRSVLNTMTGAFGLGSLAAVLDNTGGNITTVHNAENAIFAKDKDRDRYNVAYDHNDYVDGGFNPKRKQLFQKTESIVDAYTGKELPKNGQTHLDHVISAKKIHDDKLLRLSTDVHKRDKIATDVKNLVPTNSALNQSKSDNDLIEWMHSPNAKLKNGTTNAEYYHIDVDRAEDVYSIANQHYQREKTLAVFTHFGSEVAVTGVQEGFKMGCQQSFGLLLTEFFAASFDEIMDAYSNGLTANLDNPGLFEALRVRLRRITKRVLARWQDTLIAFSDGALSGFFSNLITLLINTFITTGKRIVRVIREGFMSIMNALKMMAFPPEGMTPEQATDAALKLLATGVIISLGVLTEEVVEKLVSAFVTTHIPLLVPYAGGIAAAIVGAMTGIVSALLVYGLEKLDIFGVAEQRQHEFVLNQLDHLLAQADSRDDSMQISSMTKKLIK